MAQIGEMVILNYWELFYFSVGKIVSMPEMHYNSLRPSPNVIVAVLCTMITASWVKKVEATGSCSFFRHSWKLPTNEIRLVLAMSMLPPEWIFRPKCCIFVRKFPDRLNLRGAAMSSCPSFTISNRYCLRCSIEIDAARWMCIVIWWQT